MMRKNKFSTFLFPLLSKEGSGFSQGVVVSHSAGATFNLPIGQAGFQPAYRQAGFKH